MKKVLVLTMAVLWIAVNAYGGVPQLINYQGKLTNATGAPVPDGNHDVVFKVYDVATGGTALWTETWNSSTSQIVTKGGVFNAMLGNYTTIPLSFFTDHQVTYLGITVGTDSEMAPRQRITSVGYAFTAGSAETANSASNGVPQGAIIMWSGSINQIPAGWALCDGSNGTPNLRDRFIVGAGTGYSVGATGGEASHVLTINELPSHTHIQNAHTHSLDIYGDVGPEGLRISQYSVHNFKGTAQSSSTTATNQNTGGGVGHNNLPPYYALAFIMKL